MRNYEGALMLYLLNMKKDKIKTNLFYGFFRRSFLYPFYEDLKEKFLKRSIRHVVLENKKAIIFMIPKNANRSLKKFFQNFGNLSEKYPLKKKNLKDYLKVVFVRNPYDRLVSAYNDKIKKPASSGVLASQKELYEDMPFSEFAESIFCKKVKYLDKHFRPQTFWLLDKEGNLIPDFIGKVENLKEDLEGACRKIGIKNNPPLPHINKSKRDKDYRKYYDKKTKRLVEKKYAKDIKFFDYKF